MNLVLLNNLRWIILCTLLLIVLPTSLYAKRLYKNADLYKDFDSQFYKLENKDINESSGLTFSPTQSILWTHNDSGNAAIIYAFSPTGSHIAEYLLPDFPFDWEDMASVSIDNKRYLMLADTGDNYKFRRSYRLSFYEEPNINKRANNTIINLDSTSLAWEVTFKFEKNKSYNIEATAIDALNQEILVLTKSKNKTRLFSLPLKTGQNPSANEIVEAKFIKLLPEIRRATSMDISEDGLTVAINVYGYVYLYERQAHEDWKESFAKPVKLIKYPQLFQPEAICFGKNKQEIYLTSEKRSHLLRLSLHD